MTSLPISFDDIIRAYKGMLGVAHQTPVLTSRTADRMTGAQLFFKARGAACVDAAQIGTLCDGRHLPIWSRACPERDRVVGSMRAVVRQGFDPALLRQSRSAFGERQPFRVA